MQAVVDCTPGNICGSCLREDSHPAHHAKCCRRCTHPQHNACAATSKSSLLGSSCCIGSGTATPRSCAPPPSSLSQPSESSPAADCAAALTPAARIAAQDANLPSAASFHAPMAASVPAAAAVSCVLQRMAGRHGGPPGPAVGRRATHATLCTVRRAASEASSGCIACVAAAPGAAACTWAMSRPTALRSCTRARASASARADELLPAGAAYAAYKSARCLSTHCSRSAACGGRRGDPCRARGIRDRGATAAAAAVNTGSWCNSQARAETGGTAGKTVCRARRSAEAAAQRRRAESASPPAEEMETLEADEVPEPRLGPKETAPRCWMVCTHRRNTWRALSGLLPTSDCAGATFSLPSSASGRGARTHLDDLSDGIPRKLVFIWVNCQ